VTEGAPPARFSSDEFLHMAELGAFEGMKVELDHGEIVRMNPPHTAHGAAQMNVGGSLREALRGTAFTVVGEITIVLPDDTIRAPDVAVIPSSALANQLLRAEHVVLAIEVSDTTLELDLGRKLRDYAGAGIPNYWIVDVNAKVVHVRSGPEGGQFRGQATIRFGEPLPVPGTDATIVLD